jgi:recombination protein RecA
MIFVSQTRDRIGGMGETSGTTGGNAIKFYADMRWKIWKMNDKAHESNKTTIDVIKNKLGNPFGQAKVDILWGKGFDKMGEIIDYAVQFDIIQKGGAWYAYGETKLGQGIEKTKQLFEDNPELYEEIYNKVMWQLNNKEEEPEEINENL